MRRFKLNKVLKETLQESPFSFLRVLEWVDKSDLKSDDENRVGSNPISETKEV